MSQANTGSVPDGALPDSQRGYPPRDVVNAPQIKAAIESRSSARGDTQEVHQWLVSHFYRWTVGSFEHVMPLTSLADYQRACGATSIAPAWLLQRLQSRASALSAQPGASMGAASPASSKAIPIFYVDPEHPLLVDRERVLVEFLRARHGTRLEGKLQRINCFTAMALWEEEHKRMHKRRSKGWVPSSGLALRELLRTPNGIIFEFDIGHEALREEMAYESFHMQHCLGQFAQLSKLSGGYGEQYVRDLQRGAATCVHPALRDQPAACDDQPEHTR